MKYYPRRRTKYIEIKWRNENMKKFILYIGLIALFCVAPLAFADDFRPFETKEDAGDRHASERYEQRREHGGMEPLGGYRETLGDPHQPNTPTYPDVEDRSERQGNDRW
jgi:hypothetical protein